MQQQVGINVRLGCCYRLIHSTKMPPAAIYANKIRRKVKSNRCGYRLWM